MADQDKSQSDSEKHFPLDEREYRDEHGNVHHHTNTYMEQHGAKGGSSGSDREGGDQGSRESGQGREQNRGGQHRGDQHSSGRGGKGHSGKGHSGKS